MKLGRETENIDFLSQYVCCEFVVVASALIWLENVDGGWVGGSSEHNFSTHFSYIVNVYHVQLGGLAFRIEFLG